MARDMWNPVQVEEEIRDLANRIAKNVDVCNQLYVEFLEADRVYDLEYARAFLDAKGPQTEKRYAAEAATTRWRKVRDIADAAYRLAQSRSRAMENQLSATQSIGASIRAQYGVAGRGEG